MKENPYSSPASDIDAPPVEDYELERIRIRLIAHEGSVQLLGTLHVLGASVLIVLSLWRPFGYDTWGIETILTSVISFGVGMLLFAVGLGLRKLSRWAQFAAGLFSGVGLLIFLLNFPIGMIMNACILYLLFSHKGGRVFADDYKHVIAATPHIKFKLPISVWIFAAVLTVLGILAVVALIVMIYPHFTRPVSGML